MLIQITRNLLFNNFKSIQRVLKTNEAKSDKFNIFLSSKNNFIQTSKFSQNIVTIYFYYYQEFSYLKNRF